MLTAAVSILEPFRVGGLSSLTAEIRLELQSFGRLQKLLKHCIAAGWKCPRPRAQ